MERNKDHDENTYIDNFQITTHDLFVQKMIILIFTLFTCVFLTAAISYELNY